MGWACWVVDGYADLDQVGRPGLGANAHAEVGMSVIGVTKSPVPLGGPRGVGAALVFGAPLFVTAPGMPAADAADLARRMATGTNCLRRCAVSSPRPGRPSAATMTG